MNVDITSLEILLAIALVIFAVCLIYDMFVDDEKKDKYKPPKHGGL